MVSNQILPHAADDCFAIAASLAFVLAILIGAERINATGFVSAEVGRKVVHISVSHWWLILVVLPVDRVAALIGPSLYLSVLLAVRSVRAGSWRKGRALAQWVSSVISAGHRVAAGDPMAEGARVAADATRPGGTGTVLFPVALIVLILLCVDGPLNRIAGLAGALAMGWGDGLASLVGSRVDSPSVSLLGARRSVAGVTAMFVATLVVAIAIATVFPSASVDGSIHLPRAISVLRCVAIAAAATALEFGAPLGLDNLTVPIGTALLWSFLAP